MCYQELEQGRPSKRINNPIISEPKGIGDADVKMNIYKPDITGDGFYDDLQVKCV